MKLKTTHIGSLPFKSVDDAIEYTLKFDLPCLFTLPQISEDQLMGADLIKMLGLGEIKNNKYYKKIDIQEIEQMSSPRFYDDLLTQLIGKDFKYQLIGPFSFVCYLSYYEEKLELNDVFDIYLNIIVKKLKQMKEQGLSLFFLDEPFLDKASFEQLGEYKAFYQKFVSLLEIEVGIHCCSALSEKQIDFIGLNNLQLNPSLYLESKFYLNSIKYISLPVHNYHLPQVIGSKYSNSMTKRYLTPACGLGLSPINKLSRIIKDLEMSKAILLTLKA